MKITYIMSFLVFFYGSVFSFQYSFLNNSNSVVLLNELLQRNGFTERSIEKLNILIRQYNSKIEFINNTISGFKVCDEEHLFYFKRFFINGGKYYVNCRVGIFDLITYFVKTKSSKRSTTRYLEREWKSLKKIYPGLNKSQKQLYISLFAPFTIPREKKVDSVLINKAYDLYITWHKKEGLRYFKTNNVSLLNVVVVYPSGIAAPDHSALLFRQSDSKYYLFEKRSPRDPFMLSIHSDLKSVYLYLYRMFKDFHGRGIIILQNDNLVWKAINSK